MRLTPQSRSLRLLIALALLTFTAALPACGEKSEAPAREAAAAGSGIPSASRAMRVTGEMEVVVAEVDSTVEMLRQAVREAGGYVADAQTEGTSKQRSSRLELKVPVAELDTLRSTIAGAGTVTRQSEKAEDVTEQRADLKARVRNAHAEEKRILDLLAERTGTLADVMAAEKLLAEVRDKIERLEAQDSTLDTQIAFATLRLHLSSAHTVESTGQRLVAAGASGVKVLGQTLVGIAVVVATIGPTVLTLAMIGYGLYRIRKAISLYKKPPKSGAATPS